MWKNIISLLIVFSLITIVVVLNFTDIGEKQSTPNIVDVTGDTSVDGVTITKYQAIARRRNCTWLYIN